MKLDLSKFTNAAAGSMTTAKAELFFYLSSKPVKVEDSSAGQKAEPPKQFGNTVTADDVEKSSDSALSFLSEKKDKTGKAKKQLEQMEEKVKAAANQIDDSTGAALSKRAEELTKRKDAEERCRVTFQFNPATLSVSAFGKGIPPAAAYGSKPGESAGNKAGDNGDQVEFGPLEETVTVSFQVVFDAVNNQRAFLSDAVDVSPTNLVRQGVSLIKSASYSVRPVVEGFLAAVRDSDVRGVIFQWGSMRYGGYLSKAQCCYTMFDVEGEAVRAEVELSLVCGCHEGYNHIKEWQDRYAAFMKNRSTNFSLQDHAWRSAFVASTGFSKVEKACILFRAPSASAGIGTGTKAETGTKPDTDAQTETEAEKEADEKLQTEKETNADENAESKALARMAAAIWSAANQFSVNQQEKAEKSDKSDEDIKKQKAELNQEVKAVGYVPVKIHYNPASVTIVSQADEDSDPAASQPNAMPMETALSMDLFFDETDNADAFMLDSGMGSPTGMVRTGLHMKSKMEGKECSVAPISELFVAATMFTYSRPVCFVWNKMVFWGELSKADVEYTMFNNRGNPIRSKVSICIRQSVYASKESDFEKVWQRAFDKLPEEAEKLAKNKGLTSSSGNYIASNLFRM